MKLINNLFRAPIPLVVSEEKYSRKRKRMFSGTMEINPKKIQLPEEAVS